jgi:hypothetical protein
LAIAWSNAASREAAPGELGKVGLGYLAMADDPLNGNTGIRDI